MKELELKEMMARHRQELSEKDITINLVCDRRRPSRGQTNVSASCMKSSSSFFLILQLEEANRTLTSDVANLANEKEELNNKMKEALEGMELLFSDD